MLRSSSANSLELSRRIASRISSNSWPARVPSAKACDTASSRVASAARCIPSRVSSNCCRSVLIRSWFSGRSIRCCNSSTSANICRCSSSNRFSRRRASSRSASVFASCNAVCNSFSCSFTSCCRRASSCKRFNTCNCSRRSSSCGAWASRCVSYRFSDWARSSSLSCC